MKAIWLGPMVTRRMRPSMGGLYVAAKLFNTGRRDTSMMHVTRARVEMSHVPPARWQRWRCDWRLADGRGDHAKPALRPGKWDRAGLRGVRQSGRRGHAARRGPGRADGDVAARVLRRSRRPRLSCGAL